MSQQNLVSFAMSEEQINEIKSGIKNLHEKLFPLLKVLSAEERIELPKMGDKTQAFVRKSIDHAGENPELVPAYLDLAEFKRDMKAFEDLRSIFQPLSQLADAVSDTLLLAGSDAYAAALVFYSAVKAAAKTNTPKSQNIYNDLSVRFPGRKGSK